MNLWKKSEAELCDGAACGPFCSRVANRVELEKKMPIFRNTRILHEESILD